MAWLLPTVILILTALGAFSLLSFRRASGQASSPMARWALPALLAILALALLLAPDSTAWQWHWRALDDTVGHALHAPGSILGAELLALLALSLLPAAGGDAAETRLWPALGFWTAALALAALTVDHFLLRIIVLDLAALGVLVILAEREFAAGAESRLLPPFLMLRLGDLGLLFLALSLWAVAGTWDIETMLHSGPLLTPGHLILVVIGGFVSVTAKMAMPPLCRWLRLALTVEDERQEWLAGGVLPILGVYLLYRLQPLIAEAGLVGWMRALGILWLALCVLMALVNARRDRDTAYAWLAAHASLIWLMPAKPWLYVYLYSFLPLRWAYLRFLAQDRPAAALGGEVMQRTMILARWLDCWAEGEGLAGFVRWPGRLASWVSLRLQALHTGRLRTNMIWAVLLMATMIVLAVGWMGG